MQTQRSIIATIFLIFFSVIQLADLHVMEHDDLNDVDCNICQLASENHDNDGYIGSEISTISCPHIVPADIVRSNYEQSYFTTEINYSFLNRPPPSA